VKKLFLLTVFCFIITSLIGCNSSNTTISSKENSHSSTKNVNSEINEEVGIEEGTKESIEENYIGQLEALNKKDIQKYKSLFYSDLSPQSIGYLQEIMELDGEYTLKDFDVIYQKGDEAVAVWDTVLITKKTSPSYNYNQQVKGIEVYKKTDKGWKSISDFFYEDITIVFLDENGKPDPLFEEDNTDYSYSWMPEFEKLKKEKLEPTIWFHNVFGSLYTSEY
jgi:hypothetical protein